MLDPIGETFNCFQVKERLRQDVWGTVYRAYDPKFERQVAIQILRSDLSSNAQAVDTYLQLARTILRWRCRGIVRFFDFGEFEGQIYSIQEYIAGPDLGQALARLRAASAWISLSEAVTLVIEICQSLEYAHQRSVAHGDLKASNILLSAEPGNELPYQPVLVNLGFGLWNEDGVANATEESKLVLEDIHAAGKLLFTLVSGEEPDLEHADSIQPALPAADLALHLKNYRPDLPHSLERVILRALSRKPGEGYESIQTLSSALTELLPVARRIVSAPDGFQSVSSLISVLTDKPEIDSHPPTGSANKGHAADISAPESNTAVIHILLPDQTVRSIPFQGRRMTIGRDEANEITLDQVGISRRHAQIEFDGNHYQVTDLQSTNGVYLDDIRLLPNVPQPWLPGENLRIGEVWLRLEQAEQEHSTVAVPAAAPTKEPDTEKILPASAPVLEDTHEKPLPKYEPVSAFSLESNLTVTPGKSVSAPVVLYNRSTKPDIYYLEIQGVPSEWMPNRPQSVSVPASGQKEITLVFRPPRSYASRAGRHTIILRVTSQNDPQQSTELRLALTIAAFTQFTSELQPKQLRAGASGLLVVRNLGNIPETFNLSWEDRTGELSFDPKRANAVVPAGETVQIGYQVSRTQAIWFGGEKINSFSVNVASQSGQIQNHTGSLVSQALIPRWALITLVSLCLILSCVMVIFTNQLLGSGPNARATDIATQTLGAIFYQKTAEAITATAASAAGANQATIQAITATAMWKEADDDGDGLSNAQEILLFTRPDLADTDEDGLSDGDEINIYRTYPLTADSDGDGLKDGEEIQRRTDPLKRDTDGDGLDDAIDPDPLNTPTTTVQATSTQTLTPTASATATITPTASPLPNVANLSLALTNNTTTSIPGANTAYTILIRNNSAIVVNNVQVVDAFPAILLNVTWNCIASSGSSCQTANGLGNINHMVNLAPGGAATFTISATISPTATGLLINAANVALPAGMSDPDPSDNQAMDTDGLTPTVNLTISKTDNRTTVEPGEAIAYTVVVTNSGPERGD